MAQIFKDTLDKASAAASRSFPRLFKPPCPRLSSGKPQESVSEIHRSRLRFHPASLHERILKALVFLALVAVFPGISTAGDASVNDLIEVGTPLTPHVGYRLEKKGKDLQIIIEADPLPGTTARPRVEVGVAAGQPLLLKGDPAKAEGKDGRARYQFSTPFPKADRAGKEADQVRMAFCVEWEGDLPGKPRLRNRFLHVGPGAVHRKLSTDPADWETLSLSDQARIFEERRQEIAFPFPQPLDGKATLVIEDANGKRIRNLISSQPMRKGEHRIVWDGADDDGVIVPPGEYRWRSISHPGLSPVYQTEFFNAPGSNHGTMQAAASNGHSLFLAASLAEGGYEFVELDFQGNLVRGLNFPHGHGMSRVFLAAGSKVVYLVHEGRGWSDGKVDRRKPDWKALYHVTLARLDLESGKLLPFADKTPYLRLMTYEVGPGTPRQRADRANRAGGLALLGTRLYVGDRDTGEIVVLEADSGKEVRRFPLAKPVALASGKETLYGISGTRLVKIDPRTGKSEVVCKLGGKPASLAIGPDGTFYVADKESQQVHLYSSAGKKLRSIGKEGGLVAGRYDPLRLENPGGMTVIGDEIWVTETNRWQPKRFAAYHTGTGKVVKEFFGPPPYGSPGGGFDPLDHEQWIGQETFVHVDFATGKAEPQAVMEVIGKNNGASIRRYQYWRQDGRTFLICSGKATYIQEILPDQTVKRRAMISSAHQFCYSFGWTPPVEFIRAFEAAYPEGKVERWQEGGEERIRANHGYGMMWVDLNGDGRFQQEEFNFSTDAESFGGAGWSHDFHDLTLRMVATVKGQNVLVAIPPDGFYENGVPRYPSLNEALKSAIPIDLPGSTGVESAVDRFGTLVVSSSPMMCAYAPDGRRLWNYPNRWANVHGSHNAPLPVTGQLQGVLFFSGMAKLDDKSDVFFLNGNHGQGFLMTSDGLYLDALFPDVRMMTNPFAGGIGILGGECFGGTFGRSEKDGNFYFQGGGLGYRVYRIEGLREARRGEGTIQVSRDQVEVAERRVSRRSLEEVKPAECEIPWLQEIKPDALPEIAQWKKGSLYPVSVRAARDAGELHLVYTVKDASPWVNNGTDWQALFKTGDGIDLQLGSNPDADPRRLQPVPGDLRLFIAPMGKENVAVLYRHRAPDAPKEEAVVFQSPWRSEKVDQVIRLDDVKLDISRNNDGYRVYARIPLKRLGLDPRKALSLRGDFGVIYGDAGGTVNILRNYWSNQATGLMNDVPGEIMLTPGQWGTLHFAPAPLPQ